jgi:hypothetical protein
VTDPLLAGIGNVEPETATPVPEHPNRRRWWLIGVLALVLAAAVILIAVLALNKSGPAYHVSYTSVQPVGQSAAKVVIVVKNTGSSPGTPTCTIRVTVPGSTGSGTGTFTENRPINGGDVNLYVNTVPISNGAAHLVKRSDVSVACHTVKP